MISPPPFRYLAKNQIGVSRPGRASCKRSTDRSHCGPGRARFAHRDSDWGPGRGAAPCGTRGTSSGTRSMALLMSAALDTRSFPSTIITRTTSLCKTSRAFIWASARRHAALASSWQSAQQGTASKVRVAVERQLLHFIALQSSPPAGTSGGAHGMVRTSPGWPCGPLSRSPCGPGSRTPATSLRA